MSVASIRQRPVLVSLDGLWVGGRCVGVPLALAELPLQTVAGLWGSAWAAPPDMVGMAKGWLTAGGLAD